ncbi:MAG TPA: deaminase [Candidatus Paceibacterota bacterium]
MNDKYPYLPEGRSIEYVSIDNIFMKKAMDIRNSLSTDINHPTGAVIVMNNEIIGRGANQSALKNKTLMDLHKNNICIRKILNIRSGEKYWLCPGCASSKHHAESRAVRDALSRRESIQDADLYLYGHWWCCKPCWDSMIEAGINHIYLVDNADQLFKK